ncbi:MAG TPA: hypothetical protein VF865_17035 [Acidobacteriaceae bacterium]
MKQYKTGRVLSALFLGIMFGIYRHFDEMRSLGGGREAYLVVQSHRFDRMVQYHSTGTMLIAGIILAGILFGLYELLAAGITMVLPPSTVEE